VTAGAGGPEIEDYIVRQLSGPGFRPAIAVHQVGRENLLNLVARGFGITLTTASTLGTTYPGVAFRPIESDANYVDSSAVWLASNQNPALRRLLELTQSPKRWDLCTAGVVHGSDRVGREFPDQSLMAHPRWTREGFSVLDPEAKT
jgi:hypothetical protein